MNIFKWFVLCVTLILSITAKSQFLDKKFFLVDSLNKQNLELTEFNDLNSAMKNYHAAKHDSSKIKILNSYIENCLNDLVWPKYNLYCLQLCETNIGKHPTEKFYKQYKSNCINNIGVIALNKGDFNTALKYFKNGLEISEQINYTYGVSQGLNNIGYIYQEQGNLPLALETHFKSLKIKELLHDSVGLGFAYNNIAYIYQLEKQTSEALKYNYKALDIRTKINDAEGMHLSLINLASIKQAQGDLKEALKLNQQSLLIALKANYLRGQAQSTRGICNSYLHAEKYDSAKFYCNKAIELNIKLEYFEGLLNCYIDMTNILLNQNDLSAAEAYALKSLPIAEASASVENSKNVYDLLYRIYKAKGDHTKALKMHEKLIVLKDSLLNIENKSALIRNQLEYDHEKQKAIQDAKHQKDVEVAEQQKKKQIVIIISIIFILIIISVFAVILKRRLDITSKQKNIIEHQKHLVDEKQKEIIDSIRYAKRIQNAILKSEEHESEHLPEHFILFKPKDIVSGDFYWAFERNKYLYLAAADCTGHGVPGAFLTMLGISFLNEICADEKLLNPAEIIDLLRARLIKELNQTGASGESKDGMDISLLRLNLDTFQLDWAGANNPIYIISKNTLQEIKGDKQPVGYSYDMKDFTNHSLQLAKGDYVTIFTDGYADQFGGEKGKKYKYSALKEKLIKIHQEPMSNQKQLLDIEFENWRGNLEQVDDVCVIALRV